MPAFRVSRLLRQYVSKQREIHLRRQGMDRDNFLHDQKNGSLGYFVGTVTFSFLLYKAYVHYLINLEHRFSRMSIEDRKAADRTHEPQFWMMNRRHTYFERGMENIEYFRMVWIAMIQPWKVWAYPRKVTEDAVREYEHDGWANDKARASVWAGNI